MRSDGRREIKVVPRSSGVPSQPLLSSRHLNKKKKKKCLRSSGSAPSGVLSYFLLRIVRTSRAPINCCTSLRGGSDESSTGRNNNKQVPRLAECSSTLSTRSVCVAPRRPHTPPIGWPTCCGAFLRSGGRELELELEGGGTTVPGDTLGSQVR